MRILMQIQAQKIGTKRVRHYCRSLTLVSFSVLGLMLIACADFSDIYGDFGEPISVPFLPGVMLVSTREDFCDLDGEGNLVVAIRNGGNQTVHRIDLRLRYSDHVDIAGQAHVFHVYPKYPKGVRSTVEEIGPGEERQVKFKISEYTSNQPSTPIFFSISGRGIERATGQCVPHGNITAG